MNKVGDSVNGWFLALIILHVLSLGITLAQHGKPREGKHNFFSTLVSSAIIFTLMYFAIKTGF